MVFSFVSCNKDQNENPDNVEGGDNTDNGNNQDFIPAVYSDYTVTIIDESGEPISDVSVFVHMDGGADYNVCTAPVKTDKDGKAVFNLEEGKLYSVSLVGVHQKYLNKTGKTRADRYIIDTLNTLITLEFNENYVPARYNLGDVMPNFTLTDINGNVYELSALLEEKEAVVLNFWFYGCGPCQSEFPALNSAYNKYKDSIEVLAINDYPDDNLARVKSYAKDKKLTLDMPLFRGEYGSRVSISRFDSNGYPTTVVIDRYGKICFIHVGAVTNTSYWNKLFAYVTSDDYTSTVINSFNDIP